MKYIKPYLIFTVAVWLPWGLICVFNTDIIAEIIGVQGLNPSGVTDIRVMYGGVQLGVGIMAAYALYDRRVFRNLVTTLAFLGSCMALSRSYGLIADGSSSVYTWGVMAYEYFAAVSGITWLLVLPRLQERV